MPAGNILEDANTLAEYDRVIKWPQAIQFSEKTD